MTEGSEREVILEYRIVGRWVKVTAVDTETLVEVSIVGSPRAGEEALKRTALDKLAYVLERHRSTAESTR